MAADFNTDEPAASKVDSTVELTKDVATDAKFEVGAVVSAGVVAIASTIDDVVARKRTETAVSRPAVPDTSTMDEAIVARMVVGAGPEIDVIAGSKLVSAAVMIVVEGSDDANPVRFGTTCS